MLQGFSSKEYYDFYDAKDGTVIVFPSKKGMKLVEEYYSNKYNTKMVFPHSEFDGFIVRANFAENAEKVIKEIREAHIAEKNYRQAFIFGGGHAIPLIYIKEENEEGFLYSDSKGTVDSYFVEWLKKNTGINIYATQIPRQADIKSCYTDALILGRDTTAVDPQSNQYRIPNLLAKLKNRPNGEKKEYYIPTLLPDALLKTSQISSFTERNKEASDNIIHKNETLKEFRARYTKLATIKGQQKKISSYLVDKGIKFADIIEIQFYINKINETLGPLSKEMIRKFVLLAKKEFKTQGPAAIERKGLHEMANNFIKNIKEHQLEGDKSSQHKKP